MSQDVQIRLLGPVELWSGDQQIAVTSAKQRCVLAALALTPGHLVPIDVLVDRVWGESLPSDVRGVLYSYVARLRKTLGEGVDIIRRSGGYLLDVSAEAVDLARFRQLTKQAKQARGTEPEQSATLLRTALALWRGAPFVNLAGEWAVRTRDNLLQQRLGVLTDLAELEISLGREAALVDELAGWVEEYPHSEPLIARLLSCLARTGRRAEALDLYARTRERFADELGEEPGPELQRLHQRILRRDPTLEAPVEPAPAAEPPAAGPAVLAASAGGAASASGPAPATSVPRQLPRRAGSFVGRTPELAAAQAALRRADTGGCAVVAVYGPGGIGKSALASEIAHSVVEAFPDGQLYADLQAGAGAGAGRPGTGTLEVLSRFLRGLGVDSGAVPADPYEASALFRSLTADRQLFVVLDNAGTAAQVRPLLPAGIDCAALVTSRTPLTTLDDAVHIGLDVLSPDDAAAVLTQLDATGRCAAEPELTLRLAELCGHLPLALRITAARVMSRPAWPVSAFVERLEDRRRRLDELGHADLDVRACFDITYRTLADSDDLAGQQAVRAFRFLGLLDGPDIATPIAARLLDLPEREAADALDRLADAQFLQSPAPDRFQMHDLVRDYAREMAHEHETVDARRAALDRAWACWTATAARASQLIRSGPRNAKLDTTGALPLADRAEALAWTEQEYPNLLAIVYQAAARDDESSRTTMLVVTALGPFLDIRTLRLDARHCLEQALAVARKLGDERAEADHAERMAYGLTSQSKLDEAEEWYERSLEICRRIGYRHGEGVALNNYGSLLSQRAQYDRAISMLAEVLDIKRELGDRHGERIALFNLGTCLTFVGRYDEAISTLERSLANARERDDAVGQAVTLNNLAYALLLKGSLDESAQAARRALAINRSIGNSRSEAVSLAALGSAELSRGRPAEAIELLQQAMTIADELGFVRLKAELHADLARALRLSGRVSLAIRHGEQGLVACRAGTMPFEEAIVHWRLGEALLEGGKPQRAQWFLREAYERLREYGNPQAEQIRPLLEDASAAEHNAG
ncbi:AfsR/SARP family transcriptional regulator [Flindersiella endophytica]